MQIEKSLLPVSSVTQIITGIRNGITSAQGLATAIEYGCKTYAVDTGSRNVIFHPKIYLAKNAVEARIVLGSANLTRGGLNSNIEASVIMRLDLTKEDDAKFVADIEKEIKVMIANYTKNVFQVSDAAAVQQLLKAGRVIDENIVLAPTPTGSSGQFDLDAIPKMILKTKPIKIPVIGPVALAAGPVPTLICPP